MDVSVDRFHIEFHVEIQVDAIKWSLADGTESDGYSEEWAALKKRISTNEERPLNQSSTTAMTSLSRNQSPRNRILRLVFFGFFSAGGFLVFFWQKRNLNKPPKNLSAGGSVQTIPAHKYVLATGSSVFYAMFFGGLAESQQHIKVPDVEPAAFLTLLK